VLPEQAVLIFPKQASGCVARIGSRAETGCTPPVGAGLEAASGQRNALHPLVRHQRYQHRHSANLCFLQFSKQSQSAPVCLAPQAPRSKLHRRALCSTKSKPDNGGTSGCRAKLILLLYMQTSCNLTRRYNQLAGRLHVLLIMRSDHFRRDTASVIL
jgi:hypothetical protein